MISLPTSSNCAAGKGRTMLISPPCWCYLLKEVDVGTASHTTIADLFPKFCQALANLPPENVFHRLRGRMRMSVMVRPDIRKDDYLRDFKTMVQPGPVHTEEIQQQPSLSASLNSGRRNCPARFRLLCHTILPLLPIHAE